MKDNPTSKSTKTVSLTVSLHKDDVGQRVAVQLGPSWCGTLHLLCLYSRSRRFWKAGSTLQPCSRACQDFEHVLQPEQSDDCRQQQYVH